MNNFFYQSIINLPIVKPEHDLVDVVNQAKDEGNVHYNFFGDLQSWGFAIDLHAWIQVNKLNGDIELLIRLLQDYTLPSLHFGFLVHVNA